jgi:hypothetical protein
MPEDDVTRLAPSGAPAAKTPSSPSGGTSGWLSSSGSIDHGRFPPGTILGGRYCIAGKVGKAGWAKCSAPTT